MMRSFLVLSLQTWFQASCSEDSDNEEACVSSGDGDDDEVPYPGAGNIERDSIASASGMAKGDGGASEIPMEAITVVPMDKPPIVKMM
ncbi:Hypothetical predicted protein [Olea europaea subsp. europaea]|uniref:Secreted protein n=1 Tax=Olea europaea subsp. europaea TaxID=158383 RepID=A0A8S0QKN5_OLEEU|nr:Hypothetical predicted protein [Olea europaea subsp. europaea]